MSSICQSNILNLTTLLSLFPISFLQQGSKTTSVSVDEIFGWNPFHSTQQDQPSK